MCCKLPEIPNFKKSYTWCKNCTIGSDCKILFCGDFKQSDFRNVNEKQGMHNFMEILSGMRSFNTVKFTQNDIVRSNMVREYIIQKDNLNY